MLVCLGRQIDILTLQCVVFGLDFTVKSSHRKENHKRGPVNISIISPRQKLHWDQILFSDFHSNLTYFYSFRSDLSNASKWFSKIWKSFIK